VGKSNLGDVEAVTQECYVNPPLHNLPAPTHSFIGRDKELSALASLLWRARLIQTRTAKYRSSAFVLSGLPSPH